MKTKLTSIFVLLRPFTLLAPLIVSSCVMIASFVYNDYTLSSVSSLIFTIGISSLSLALLNGASNALNQATDIHEDRLSKPYRPIPSGLIQPRDAYILAAIFYIVAVILSLFVHVVFHMFILIVAVFTITYSIPPRMKRILFFNQLWVAIPRGLLGILAAWSVFGNPFHHIPLAIGGIAALFLFGGTTTKDLLDAKADKQTGIHTLINHVGVQKTAIIACFCMTSAFLLILPLIFLEIIDWYLLPLLFLSGLSVYIAWLMTHDYKNQRCENTASWKMMYTTYFLFALSFALLTILFS